MNRQKKLSPPSKSKLLSVLQEVGPMAASQGLALWLDEAVDSGWTAEEITNFWITYEEVYAQYKSVGITRS